MDEIKKEDREIEGRTGDTTLCERKKNNINYYEKEEKGKDFLNPIFLNKAIMFYYFYLVSQHHNSPFCYSKP